MSNGKFISDYPNLMKQWDYEKNVLEPKKTAAKTHKFAWWLCEMGHSWEAMIKNRVLTDCGCPYCTSKKVLPGFNDLCTTEPRIADEWNHEKNGDLKPEMFMRHSKNVVWWRCKKEGHEWDMSITHRSVGYNCPYCSGKRVLAGYNDLLTLNSQLADEWDFDKNEDLLPSQVTVSSGKRVFWKCSKSHSWKAEIAARNIGGNGCPVCDGKVVKAGFNDLQTHNPQLADEWDYDKNTILPSQVTPFSLKKIWWKCKEGHSWKAAISGRSVGNGCPICSGRKILVGFNDLKTVNPALADEWDYDKNDLLPTQVTAHSNRKIWWKCKMGHSWQSNPDNRSRGDDCPFCSGRYVLAGFNDLATLNPELADEWAFDKNTLLPSQVTIFSDKKVWWMCKEKGHLWKTSVAARSTGRNCPYCLGRIFYTPKCVY